MAERDFAQEALRLTAKLAKQLSDVVVRLSALEKAIRGSPPKGTTGQLTEAEWLARRRAVLRENAKNRWAKKKATTKPTTAKPSKPKAAKQ